MISSLISGAIDGIVTAIFGWINSIMEKRGLIQQGQAQQAAATTANTATVQARIANAEAQAPQTKDAALDRLRAGDA